jgi:predicted Holliday junction resolvase-like endonuclease
MLLIQFLFLVQIIEMENRLSRVEKEHKAMKEEARRKEQTTKKEEAKRLKETTKDMVARVAPRILLRRCRCSSCLFNYICFVVYIYMDE